MATLHVLKVFVGPDGAGGNPLGVFLAGTAVAEDRRQAVAADLGFSETVFVDDASTGALRIFTPANELPFAGHPLVGTSWLLRHLGTPVDVLRPPAGEVPTWVDGDGLTWIRGSADWAPAMRFEQLDSPAAVDALEGPPEGVGFLDAWAWEDEPSGRIRARVFAPAFGIREDEATGAAALALTARLGRPVVIRQGQGSVLYARPHGRAPGAVQSVDVGGAVELVETRDYG